jgi:hypothetical protein
MESGNVLLNVIITSKYNNRYTLSKVSILPKFEPSVPTLPECREVRFL